jgi:heavy metal efflux system protein
MAVGRQAGVVLEKDRRFGLNVLSAIDFQGNLDVLRSLPLKSTLGQIVPLGDVAEVTLEKGPALVNRDRQSRRLIVEFNVRGRDVVSTVEEARTRIATAVTLPAGYRSEWGASSNTTSARGRG